MYGAHRLHADVNGLHLNRKKGGRGLIRTKNCVKTEKESLLKCIYHKVKRTYRWQYVRKSHCRREKEK